MSEIQTNNRISKNKLLQATANLDTQELDAFVNQAITLRAKRIASSIPQNEAELLLKINQGLSPKLQKRFDELAKKLESESITAKERKEFLQLTDRIEKQDAERIELLGELAEIRQITLDDLMRNLEIGQT